MDSPLNCSVKRIAI
uniref:Uncharacterized protein n=1 Tax=Rhizophora mucronata TaxID=61149 RepID=A0A2P2NC01_RHIMU